MSAATTVSDRTRGCESCHFSLPEFGKSRFSRCPPMPGHFCPCSSAIAYSTSGREDNQLCQALGNTGVKDTGLFQQLENICTTSNHGNMTALLEASSVYLDVRYTLKKTSTYHLR